MSAIEDIFVGAEILASAISQFESANSDAQNAYMQMTDAVFALDSTWNGEASEAFKDSYNNLLTNLKTSDSTLEKALTDLKKAQVVYEGIETTLESILAALTESTDPFSAG